jgi:hypothetical protein
MKKIVLAAALALVAAMAHAQDYKLHWKYKDYPGAITFSASDPFIHMGSWFLEERAERRLFNKIDKMRVLVFEDYSPVMKKDLAKFHRKVANGKKLQDLVMVRKGQTQVRVLVKERNTAIRKLVVLVQEPGTFVLGAIRGKIRYEDINAFLRDTEARFNVPEIEELRESVQKRPVIRI